MKPGRYETAANLGTFYLHAGIFKKVLAYIEKALKINPDAHFGREKYQKLLVEYIIPEPGHPQYYNNPCWDFWLEMVIGQKPLKTNC